VRGCGASPLKSIFVPKGNTPYNTRGVWDGNWDRWGQETKGYRVQNGSQIHGMVVNGVKPMLRLVEVRGGSPPQNVGISSSTADGQAYTSITDLTVDCNAPALTLNNGTPMWLAGAALWGDHMTISNVVVVNATQNDTTASLTTEVFIVQIVATSYTSTGNLIKDCVVSNFYNLSGYANCSAIMLNHPTESRGYISGIIDHCKVVLHGPGDPGWGGEFAYNSFQTFGCVLTNCTAIGGQRGFNNDTASNEGFSFVNNTFDLTGNTSYGFYIVNGSTWCRFSGNTIIFRSYGCNGIVIDGQTPTNFASYNILFDRNTFYATNDWSGTSYAINFNDGGLGQKVPTHINVENNTILADPRLSSLIPASVGYVAGNTGTIMSGNAPNYAPPLQQPNFGWAFTPCRADVNRDGGIDFVFQDAYTCITIWLMSGTTRLTSINTTPAIAGGTWQVVGTGDIDRNGTTDLFFEDGDGNLGYWALDTGSNLVNAGPLNPSNAGPGWRIVAVGDFNHDSKPDLLFQHSTSQLGVWFMDGANLISPSLLTPDYPSDLYWKMVGTGDFDHDGNADIVFQYQNPGNPADSQLGVWFMNSNGVTLRQAALLNPMYPGDVNWRVVGTADFNSDWWTDVLFQQWGGSLMMWPMNGTSRSGVAQYPPSPLTPMNVCGPR
jgi:hypothetical protein